MPILGRWMGAANSFTDVPNLSHMERLEGGLDTLSNHLSDLSSLAVAHDEFTQSVYLFAFTSHSIPMTSPCASP
jgi:hypothetical protein